MPRKLRWLWLAALAVAALLPLAAACGDDGGGPTPPANQSPPAGQLQPQPEPAQELDAQETGPQDGAIQVSAAERRFGPNNLKVPLGQPVTIRVTNADTVTHDLRIAGPDGQFNTEDDAVTEPPAITAGSAGELTFSPQIAGAYTFQCDFHAGSMGGQIVVE